MNAGGFVAVGVASAGRKEAGFVSGAGDGTAMGKGHSMEGAHVCGGCRRERKGYGSCVPLRDARQHAEHFIQEIGGDQGG